MSTAEVPARIHLLPARAKARAVILRRKPSKLWHVMLWHTDKDEIEHGSWFRGKLYPLRSDVSFDGRFMVYLAMGADGNTWNGVCRLPWLKTECEGENMGTWNGGGWFQDKRTLMINNWEPKGPRLPFRLTPMEHCMGEDDPVLHARMERDGWVRAGEFGTDRELKGNTYRVAHDGDAGWTWQPTRKHPVLRCYYRGYLQHGHTFEFVLDGSDEVLDASVQWACWDARGQLLVSRNGGVERWTLRDLANGEPGFAVSFEELEPTV